MQHCGAARKLAPAPRCATFGGKALEVTAGERGRPPACRRDACAPRLSSGTAMKAKCHQMSHTPAPPLHPRRGRQPRLRPPRTGQPRRRPSPKPRLVQVVPTPQSARRFPQAFFAYQIPQGRPPSGMFRSGVPDRRFAARTRIPLRQDCLRTAALRRVRHHHLRLPRSPTAGGPPPSPRPK